jgi:DNA-binding Lrp family transcriptional regulator
MRRSTTKPFDDLDHQIVLELHADVRKSSSDIARKVGANERTVRKRIDRLIEMKAIRPTVIVEPEAFDYVTATDIFLDVKPQHEQDIIKELLAIQNVSYLAYGQGTGEISIEARFKNYEELRQFLSFTLPSIAHLLVKGYALVPRVLKNIDDWLPRKEDFSI